jgi:hypothetical protein
MENILPFCFPKEKNFSEKTNFCKKEKKTETATKFISFLWAERLLFICLDVFTKREERDREEI